MNYSLTFKPDSDASHDVNTWADWGLAPDSPPMVPHPEIEKIYVDIPGRQKGPLDMSDVLTGSVYYKRITGSWNFMGEIVSTTTRMTVENTLRKFFTGRKMKVVLADDDPNHYFFGRFDVSVPKAATNPLIVTIAFDLEPVRYNMNGTIDTTWVN